MSIETSGWFLGPTRPQTRQAPAVADLTRLGRRAWRTVSLETGNGSKCLEVAHEPASDGSDGEFG